MVTPDNEISREVWLWLNAGAVFLALFMGLGLWLFFGPWHVLGAGIATLLLGLPVVGAIGEGDGIGDDEIRRRSR
jgi:hypothetical protein